MKRRSRTPRPIRSASRDPLTLLLGAAAVVSTGWVVFGELARVRRHGGDVLQTVEVAREGYRTGEQHENALLNLLLSFNVAWVSARVATHVIHHRGPLGPFRDAILGRTRLHVHHFVPGIVLALIAGGASIVSRDEGLDPLLAVPFGVGAALTLDESALLLRLDDVYWSEEGILSVQITLASISLISAFALTWRVLRRGERRVLHERRTKPDRRLLPES